MAETKAPLAYPAAEAPEDEAALAALNAELACVRTHVSTALLAAAKAALAYMPEELAATKAPLA